MLTSSFDESPIADLIGQALSNVKTMIDVQTIVGEAIDLGDGCKIYPVMKITVGVVNGGGEYSAKKLSKKATRFPFAGGNGTGFCCDPVGFLINNAGNVTFTTIESKNIAGDILKKIGDVFEKYVESFNKTHKNEANINEK